MNLITRCPTCDTMFRVVPDQLRISNGWVRCGQCGEIFDASQTLMAPAPAGAPKPGESTPATPHPAPESPTVSNTPQPAPAPAAHVLLLRPDTDSGGTDASASTAVTPADAPDEAMALDASPIALDEPERESSRPPDQDPDPGPETGFTSPVRSTELEPARWASPQAEPELEDHAPGAPNDARASFSLPPGPVDESADLIPEPSFMRAARRRAAWQRPAVRVALSALLVVLSAALVLQLGLQERDRVAARVPMLRPALVALCGWAACTVSEPRRMDAIVIDSSDFNLVKGDDYRLSLVLRSTADIAVAMPAIELTLANIQGQTLVRRVLQPAELGLGGALTPRRDHSASLVLQVSVPTPGERVAGYSLLAFYP